MELNLYDFYNNGYSVTQLDENLLTKLWRIIYTTEWQPDPGAPGEDIPTWVKLDNLEKLENFPIEHLAAKKYLFSAPLDLKEFGQALLTSGYFDPLLAELSGGRYFEQRWINNIEILSFLLRRNTTDIPWHTDYNGIEDFFLIIYLNEESHNMSGGIIQFGKQNQSGQIEVIGEETTDTGKLICVNCTNPFFKHKVTKNSGYTRFALNIKFRINKL